MAELPILYSFRRCPYAMRARMALWVSGIALELREIILRDKPAEMVEASPKATVPVLVLTDGRVIDESLDIMHWALAQNDPENWLAGYDPALIAANDGPFKRALDRYKYPHRYGLEDGLVYRDEAMEFMAELDERLSRQDYLTGAMPTLVDIALFPFFRQFAATDQAWFDMCGLNNLRRWLSHLTSSSLFEAIMVRHHLWKAGDPPLLFHKDQFLGH